MVRAAAEGLADAVPVEELFVYDEQLPDRKNIFESFREVEKDLLVPELKAVKVSVDSLRTEMKLTTMGFGKRLLRIITIVLRS